MYKMLSKIFQLFLMFLVGVALIGVNISKGYCGYCEKGYVQLKVVPLESGCACGDENCRCAGGNACSEEKTGDSEKNAFYKVGEYSLVEQGIKLGVLFCYLPLKPDSIIVMNPVEEKNNFRDDRIYPDLPFLRERLCIYLC